MQTRAYVAIGFISAILFVISQLPFQVVWRVVGGQVASSIPFSVEKVGGTLWNGFIVGQPQQGLTDTVVLHWDFLPGALLVGRLAFDVGCESPGFKVNGTGYTSLFERGFHDVSGQADAALLAPFLQGMGVTPSGIISVTDLRMGIDKSLVVTDAAGSVFWRGGKVSVTFNGSAEQYAIPAVQGVISSVEQGAMIDVRLEEGGKPLGQAGLRGDGILSLTVLKRVMTLAGMTPDDEDKILIKTQQPLF